MRLTAQARVYLQSGEEVFRKPSFWDKMKTFVGSDVDLRTGELSIAGNALAMCEQVQQAFRVAKVTNAVSLTMDREILYQDLEDRADDADLLITAARRSASMFSQPFEAIRMVFEHEAGGVHSLIEATVRSKYKTNEPAVIVAIGGRITSLRPTEGEDQEAAKDRIGKALADQNLVPAAKAMLDALLANLEMGLSRAFAGARIDSDHADIQVVKPSRDELKDMHGNFDHRDAWLRDQPTYSSGWSYGSYYDPWSRYYRDPMDTFVNLMVLDAIMHPRPYWGYGPGYLGSSWSSYGAPVTVINYNGHPYGTADHINSFQGQLGDVGAVSNLDWSSASWDDSQLSGYDANASSFDQYSGGNAGGSWDCAGGASSGGGTSSDCSFDCTSDCAFDCASSDCSWDCSSDCSSDCGGGGSDW
jgi:hypothetical protein